MQELKAGRRFKVSGAVHNNMGRVFNDGDIATLEPANIAGSGPKLWNLKNAAGQVRCEPADVFQGWIESGFLIEIKPLSVPIEGGKYTIVMDTAGEFAGKLRIDRDMQEWIANPLGSKMLIAVAYELAALRRIAKSAIALVEYTDTGETDLLHGHIGGLADTIRSMERYTDIRQNLDKPGEI